MALLSPRLLFVKPDADGYRQGTPTYTAESLLMFIKFKKKKSVMFFFAALLILCTSYLLSFKFLISLQPDLSRVRTVLEG